MAVQPFVEKKAFFYRLVYLFILLFLLKNLDLWICSGCPLILRFRTFFVCLLEIHFLNLRDSKSSFRLFKVLDFKFHGKIFNTWIQKFTVLKNSFFNAKKHFIILHEVFRLIFLQIVLWLKCLILPQNFVHH